MMEHRDASIVRTPSARSLSMGTAQDYDEMASDEACSVWQCRPTIAMGSEADDSERSYSEDASVASSWSRGSEGQAKGDAPDSLVESVKRTENEQAKPESKMKLLSLRGFSNSHALKKKLPPRDPGYAVSTSTALNTYCAGAVNVGKQKRSAGNLQHYASTSTPTTTSFDPLDEKIKLHKKLTGNGQTQAPPTPSYLHNAADDRMALRKKWSFQARSKMNHTSTDPSSKKLQAHYLSESAPASHSATDPFSKKLRAHYLAEAAPVSATLDDSWDKLDMKMKQKQEADECAIFMHDGQSSSSLAPALLRPPVVFYLKPSHAYVILFTSSATLHCAIFNFGLELRRLFSVDLQPFGSLLLLCWVLIGFVSFIGGWIGDLVNDRVLFLRRIVVLWLLGAISFHIPYGALSPSVSLVSLIVGFPCAFLAHGIMAPNVIVLGSHTIQHKIKNEQVRHVISEAVWNSAISSGVCNELGNGGQQSLQDKKRRRFITQVAYCKHVSSCFAAAIAGSALVQLYFFLLVDLDFSEDTTSPAMMIASPGFVCMASSSFLLAMTLTYFFVKTKNYSKPELTDLERKLALTESADSFVTWKEFRRLCKRVRAGNAVLCFLLIVFLGASSALLSCFAVPDSSIALPLTAFLAITVGSVLSILVSLLQLSPDKKMFVECPNIGISARRLYETILMIALSCASIFSAFLRAQLYTVLVVQMCQLGLDVPGMSIQFHPEIIGALSSIVSLAFIPIYQKLLEVILRRSAKAEAGSEDGNSWSPSRRISYAILLSLLAFFLSSVTELYRRNSVMIPGKQQHCFKGSHANLNFLWATPHLVLAGTSDALFRVSLQEEFLSTTLASRWPGMVQGVIALSEMIGFSSALVLTSSLSPWFFGPDASDFVLLLLLVATSIAFFYVMLKQLAQKIACGRIR